MSPCFTKKYSSDLSEGLIFHMHALHILSASYLGQNSLEIQAFNWPQNFGRRRIESAHDNRSGLQKHLCFCLLAISWRTRFEERGNVLATVRWGKTTPNTCVLVHIFSEIP